MSFPVQGSCQVISGLVSVIFPHLVVEVFPAFLIIYFPGFCEGWFLGMLIFVVSIMVLWSDSFFPLTLSSPVSSSLLLAIVGVVRM